MRRGRIPVHNGSHDTPVVIRFAPLGGSVDRAVCQTSDAVPAPAPAHAGLTFPETLKEVHAAVDAKSVTVDYDFTNRSGVAVDVSRYDSACSCMGVEIKGGKLHYEPGESGVVRTIFEIGNFSGTVDKLATIWMTGDTEDNPSIRLTVRVVIPVLVESSPRTRAMGDRQGRGAPSHPYHDA